MKLSVTKKQEYVDDVAQEPSWHIKIDREYQATFRPPTNLIDVQLFKEELEALRDAINKILPPMN